MRRDKAAERDPTKRAHRVSDGRSPTFGALLKQLRLDAGLSQEALANRARISLQAVGAYERGTRRAPHRVTFALLARALDLGGEPYDELARAAERGRARGPDAQRQHNLPVALTELIGRQAVIDDVSRIVTKTRFVTLAGTGGIGKTRTALEVATRLLPRFRDGVWLAELAALEDSSLVAGTIAIALGIAQQADRPVLDTLRRRLHDRELLLVLDNCEHVVDEAARVAESILRECKGVTILATSRELLRVSGERVYRIPPLDVSDAVALFARCAASWDASFALDESNAPAVEEICRRLDGIPLAIELAAARVTTLAPAQLASELDDRFRVLAGGSRTALPRHKTMRVLLDWSHDRLSDEERTLLRRLAIFAGGATLGAVADVCDVPDFFEVLASLVDKSLVVADVGDREGRYGLLESTRAYALEKLDAAGERRVVARRHAEYVASFAADALAIEQYGRRLAALRAEVANLRSALAWCVANDDALPIAARILRDARAFLLQNLRGEALRQTRAVLDRAVRLDDDVRAELLIALALLTVGSESLDAANRAIEILERAGAARTATLLRSYHRKCYALAQLRRIPEALETNRRAMELREALGVTDAQSLRSWHCVQGYLLNCRWRLAEARAAWTTARDLALAVDDPGRAAIAACNLAETLFFEGRVDEAVALGAECLAVFRREGLAYHEALTLNNLAAYRLHGGDRAGAAADLAAAVDVARRAGDDGLMVARAVRHAATLSSAQGAHKTAAKLLGYSAAWFEARAFYDPGDDRQFEQLEAALRESLGDGALRRAMALGAALDENAAWEAACGVIAREPAVQPGR